MNFNLKKSNVVNFSFFSKDRPPLPTLYLSGKAVPVADSYKYLGITLDSKLSFKQHIENMSSKLKRQSLLIYRIISPHRNPCAPTIRSLVSSKLTSLLSYSLPFIKISNKQASTLDSILAIPLRRALSLPSTASTQATLLEFRCLPTLLLQQLRLVEFIHKLETQPPSPYQTLLSYYRNDPSFPRIPFMMTTLVKAEETIADSNLHLQQPTTKNSFLQAQFLDCKSLDSGKYLLKLYHQFSAPLPHYIKTDPHHVCNLRARLRFDLSDLNLSAFTREKVNNAACPFCINTTESRNHTLLFCPHFHLQRLALCRSLHINIDNLKIDNILDPPRSKCHITGAFLQIINKLRKI
jgi:hypothetical protein